MKTTVDRSLEGDDRARMSSPWGVHAKIEPTHDNPASRTLTLGVSDGPEAYVDFDPMKAYRNIGESTVICDDDDTEGTLLHAIGHAATAMAEEAARDEANHWIREHEHVHLVIGETSLSTWTVRAFLNRERADRFLREMNDWMSVHGFADPTTDFEAYQSAMRLKPECPDKLWQYHHLTGTKYTLASAPIDMGHAWCDVAMEDRS